MDLVCSVYDTTSRSLQVEVDAKALYLLDPREARVFFPLYLLSKIFVIICFLIVTVLMFLS
jgi:hypothetical protein